jgi:hypothetical protein
MLQVGATEEEEEEEEEEISTRAPYISASLH